MIAKINWKKNWIFGVLLLVLIFSYATRFTYLRTNVAPYPDCVIPLTTEANELEQTWQPEVKWISGVDFSYTSENTFTSDLQLKIFSDDYSQILVETVIEKHSFEEGKEGGVSFSFDRTKLIPGERYRFQISLLNADSDGTIWIVAGSNYGGCTIGGEDTKTGVALDITFAKFSKIFWLVAVVFPLFSYALFMMCITGRKFEETVALSMFVEGLILYAFGLLEELVLGLNMVYLLAFISFVASIYLYNKKAMCIKDLFSPGLIIFFVFFLIILVVNHGEWLAKRDDMRHWGVAVRDMYYYNSFAKHPGSTVIMIKYLPFAALIEYTFEFMNGLFSEDILFMAYQTMMLTVVIIFAKPLQKGKVFPKVIPVLVTMVCIPIIFYNDISSIIMVDSLQMFIVAYTLLCYFKEERTWFNMGRIACGLIVLPLIKDIGLVLAGIVALIMFLDSICQQFRKRRIDIRGIIFPISCVFMILIAYVSWQVYWSVPLKVEDSGIESVEAVEVEEITQGFVVAHSGSESGISLDGLLTILKGEGEEYQYRVTTNYLTELFDGETYKIGNVTLSFMDLLFALTFLLVTLTYFNYWNSDKIRKYSMAGIFLVVSIVLCLFLQLTYWFTFGMYEALELTSMERYLGTYVCAIMMILFYFIYEEEHEGRWKKQKSYFIYLIAFFLIISTPVNRILVKNNEVEGYATEDVVYGHDALTQILRSVATRGEKVQFICQGSSGYSGYVFRNAVCPILSEHAWWSISEPGVPAAQLKDIMQDKEYLVLFNVDDAFIQTYGGILNSDTALENGSVYKVYSDESGIKLELIGRTGIISWS